MVKGERSIFSFQWRLAVFSMKLYEVSFFDTAISFSHCQFPILCMIYDISMIYP